MDIKITMNYYLTPVRMAIIKKTKDNKYWKGYREKWTLAYQVRICRPIMENIGEISQQIKNRTTIWASNPTSGYTSKENEIWALKRYLYSHVHCSIIQNSQDMEIWNTLSVHQQMNG